MSQGDREWLVVPRAGGGMRFSVLQRQSLSLGRWKVLETAGTTARQCACASCRAMVSEMGKTVHLMFVYFPVIKLKGPVGGSVG